MIGEWQLKFLLAKKQTKGLYVPSFLTIAITYGADQRVRNTLALGVVKMVVTGPIAFYEGKNIMAFDFTHLDLYALGIKIYSGYIRKGQEREARFPKLTVAYQAFFKYFTVVPNAIAARGRGGGLAVWVKQ
ncbi:MAG: hypothetical protein HC796_00385 [Synechococcaceae cyanobacterium RL_1_2]|nr:hypothetical protein [Synechococcaceae cyanobacterium RL_1_2]